MATNNAINLAGPTPIFSAYLANSVSFGNTGGAVLLYDSTYINVGSCYNTSDGAFTAPVAGTYSFNYTVLYAITAVTGATNFFTYIGVAGHNVAWCVLPTATSCTGFAGLNGWITNTGAAVLNMAVGDSAQLLYYAAGATANSTIQGSNGTPYNAYIGTTFSGYLITQI